MLRLRHNAREAQAELLLDVHGRLPFGGVRIVDVGQSREGDRRAWWLAKRAEELASMAPPVSIDGRLRLGCSSTAHRRWMHPLNAAFSNDGVTAKRHLRLARLGARRGRRASAARSQRP
jgi:hypothetical protein